jgi:energy-coupling factor transporter ATP-binding protein EcfA2
MRRSSETPISSFSNAMSILIPNMPPDVIDNNELNEKFQECLQAIKSHNDEHVYNIIEACPELLKIRDKNNGYTLFHWLVTKEKINLEHVERFPALSFDINLPDNEGGTPLHLAVQLQKPDIVRSLIELKADPNAKDNKGQTPLHLVLIEFNKMVNPDDRIKKIFIAIIDLLFQAGADETIIDNSGQSAADFDKKDLILPLIIPLRQLNFEDTIFCADDEEKKAMEKYAPSLIGTQPWKSIPKFTIVTGRNGSGKTHLLQYAEFIAKENEKKINFIYKPSNKDGQLYSNAYLRLKKIFDDLYFQYWVPLNARKWGQATIEGRETKQYILQISPEQVIHHREKQPPIPLLPELNSLLRKIFGEKEKILEIDYHVITLPYNGRDTTFQSNIRFRHVSGNQKIFIGHEDLSSGERLILDIFCWQFYAEKAIDGLDKFERISLLLLDEPDRHFDPELSKIFMNCLTHLSKSHNIQVIMTTHRTDTLAYAPEGSIFTIKRDKITNNASIQPTNRLHALFKLTPNLREITNFHIKVYTESLDDATFYEKIYHQLLRISEAKRKAYVATPDGLARKPREILSRRFRLSFYSVAMDKLGGGGGCHVIPPAVQRETLALDNIDRAETETFVNRKIEYPFGLIDADFDVGKLNPTRIKPSFNNIKPRLLYTKRHSLENYMYDPAILFSFLNEVSIKEIDDMFQPEEEIKENRDRLKEFVRGCHQSLLAGPESAVQQAFNNYFHYFLDKFISVQEKIVESEYLQNFRYLNPNRKGTKEVGNKGGKGKGKEKEDFSEFLKVYRDTFNVPPAIKDEDIIKSVKASVNQTVEKFNKRKDGYADNRIDTRKYLKEDLKIFPEREIEQSKIVEALLNAGARDFEIFSPDGTQKYTIRYPGFFIFARGHNIEDFFQKTFISKGDQNIRTNFKKWLIDKVITTHDLFLPIDLVDTIVELDRKVTNQANTEIKPEKAPLSISPPFIN